MAHVIPSPIHSGATAGEKRLHSILAELPDDCVVYYEPDVGGLRPDFIVLCPELGILVIEDKNWYPETIQSGNRNSVTIKPRCRPLQKVDHPEQQARRYVDRLRDTAQNVRYGSRFLHADGPHQGRFKFPISYLVTLSNITRNQLDEPSRCIAPIFNLDRVATADEVKHWVDLSSDELLDALRGYFRPWFSFPGFQEDEIKALRAIIHPEINLENQFSTDDLLAAPRPIHDQQDIIKVLDERQENCARIVGEGHRILYGVAGSGKTLILLTRARLLAKSRPNSEILLVCYNRQLAKWLERSLSDLPQVTVLNFHRWGSQNGVRFSRSENESEFGIRFLTTLENGSRDKGRFDSVLVDEAQDFEPSWFRCLLAAMKDPENGDLLIVGDGAQGLYRRSKLSWKSLGIRAQGRTHSKRFDLDQNYRNTTEILSLAETFATRTEMEGEDSIQSVRVNPRLCLRQTGASPTVFVEDCRTSELLRAEDLLRSLLEGHWNGQEVASLKPSEIAILYPRIFSSKEKGLLERAVQKWSGQFGIAVSWVNGSTVFRSESDALTIQTIHSAKGLQYRAVIVLWTDMMPSYFGEMDRLEDEIADRKLLYVAMTRAESFLALTASKMSPFVEEIIQSPAAQVTDQRDKVNAVELAG